MTASTPVNVQGAPLRIDVITIFPEYLAPLRAALLGKAVDRGLVEIGVHDLRSWTHDVHRTVDDSPYGGGPGMVMKPDVWGEALDAVCPAPDPEDAGGRAPVLVVPTPAGRRFDQALARELAEEPRLVFACGRYEGIDQRVVDEAEGRMRVLEVSIGDYVLVGGEVATLVMVEAVVRLIPGVLGNPVSASEDSFSDGLLEGPCYTRPEVWRGRAVPDVLRSGNHAAVDRWRRDRALERTLRRRPDLLDVLPPEELSRADRAFLAGLEEESPQVGADGGGAGAGPIS